ncbi:MerR family transcriptional regulator [Chitinophaga sp. Mgbs1]|uniref:MerR family transcriptional regulator n=1 Tax=Chitinophaga solisilvae TaxID=1233460 RepID=A0A3S1CZU2_9BACT|nr:MerR family transcriptional regulator [Chitinophaga solisilvae]
MNTFTIKDIENFTGIKAHTIRIWEQRYQLFRPRRKDTNHRVYDKEDLKALLRVAYLYHHGIKISRIAALSEAEQNKLSVDLSSGEEKHGLHVNELIAATLDFDQQRFEGLFQRILRHTGMETCMTRIILPFLEKMGVLWLTGSIMPAQEHFSAVIIRQKIIAAIEKEEMNYAAAEHFLLFLPEGEFHEIPLLFVCYLLKKHGKRVTNLGQDVPLADLAPFMAAQRVTHIYTHLTSIARQAVQHFTEQLAAMCPQTAILLAGPQTQHIPQPLPANVRLLTSLEDLLGLIRQPSTS